MGGVASSIGGALGFGGSDSSGDSKKAAKVSAAAQIRAAEIQAESQKEALDYLKEIETTPQQFRQEALTQLGGLYGLEGGEDDQQQLIDQAIQSPLYQAIMGSEKFGEEAIMRNASMTGGLRSGNVQGAMYDYNTQLQNRALLASYNEQLGGLQGLAQLPSNANQIASGIAGIGATEAGGVAGAGQAKAQGIIAGAQTQQMQQQQGIGNLFGLGQLGISAYGAGMFSDRRIKSDILLLGKINGHNFYSFKWNKIGNALGLNGNTCGCMADEVFKINPKAVILKDGFMFVNYNSIGVL